MKITLVISSLSAGGAERVMSMLANYWAAQTHEITLITLDSCGHDFYQLETRVQRVGLGLMADSANLLDSQIQNWRRIRTLRKAMRASQPEAIISFMDQMNILTILACAGLGVPVIVSERTDPREYEIGKLWRVMRRIVYPFADTVVIQTHGVMPWARWVVRKKAISVIPNPVEPPDENSTAFGSPQLPAGRKVAAMGRLVPLKRYELLLEAFSRVAPHHPEWSLIFIGEGPERVRLENLAKEHSLTGRVLLLGKLAKPSTVLMQADIFVMSSDFEGFPNALMEAMACGLAVVSTDCPSGPREIIRVGVDGLLTPPGDAQALTAALERLMSDETERQRLAVNAKEVLVRFSLERVATMWENLIRQAQT